MRRGPALHRQVGLHSRDRAGALADPPDASIEEGLERAFAPGYDVPDEFVEDFRRQTYTSFDRGAGGDRLPREESLDRRSGARVPVLAIFGAEEQLYEPEKALAAYGALPGAQTALVQGAGHSPNVERPARTAALVLGFARARSARQARGAK